MYIALAVKAMVLLLTEHFLLSAQLPPQTIGGLSFVSLHSTINKYCHFIYQGWKTILLVLHEKRLDVEIKAPLSSN